MKITQIEEKLATEIGEGGSLGFDRFMELSLYDPECGYYCSGRSRIGGEGDFFTSVSVGPCFGMLLGRQCLELRRLMWPDEGEPEFRYMEQGADDGRLMLDVLTESTDDNSRVLLIEPLPHLRDRQSETLATLVPEERLQHAAGWSEVEEEVEGVFFCNELLDAMPVKLVRFLDGSWHERRVVADGIAGPAKGGRQQVIPEADSPRDETSARNAINTDANSGGKRKTVEEQPSLTSGYEAKSAAGLAWSDEEIVDPGLLSRVEKLGCQYPDGYTTEINLHYSDWLLGVSSRLRKGLVFVMDYGFSRDDLYNPDRSEGTLRTFHKHQAGDDPLEHAGSCDITAHVDFSELAEEALKCGFDVLGFLDQNHFLMGIGESWLLELEGRNQASQSGVGEGASNTDSLLRQFRTLTHPGIMGLDFKVLVLGKKVPDRIAKTLACLRYARPPLPQLGLAGSEQHSNSGVECGFDNGKTA